jgi:Glutathionylspermidine synthase preATP-grasp
MSGAALSVRPALGLSLGAAGLGAGDVVDRGRFAAIRRRMILEHCKWDPQVGDVSTLASFPLLLAPLVARELAETAETLARETLELERAVLRRPELFSALALPRLLRRALELASTEGATPAACRVMRFDFHPTAEGWRISEANTDVPGGFSESSAFPEMMAEAVGGAAPFGDPGSLYADALVKAAGEGRSRNGAVVALLAAAGFMEDQQVVAGLAARLRARGARGILAGPADLHWRDGRARARTLAYDGPVDAIVRFYQGEWLAKLPRSIAWQRLFAGGATPVANPGIAILSESKRLPLVWDRLGVACPAWRRALPETRDPRDAPWSTDEAWLLKSAFCNTGDSVTVRGLVPARTWRARKLEATLFPGTWLAQRRFETLPLDTPAGKMFPCIGVHTIDGRAAGMYGRLSPTPVIDYAAIDVAVLVGATRP